MAKHFAEATGEEPSGNTFIQKAAELIPALSPGINGYKLDAALGSYDMLKNYMTMRMADTIGADKYCHCKGNCEATQRGIGGRHAATALSELREWNDQERKGDTPEAVAADQRANRYGRNTHTGTSCKGHCSDFRPDGLRKVWW